MCKSYTYLAPKLTLSPNRPKQDFVWHTSSRSSIICVQIDFPAIWYVPCKPCTYLASRLALPPNRPNRASTWAPSPKSTNKCVQNGFLDYGALGANCAPLLHQSEIPYNTRHQGVPSGAFKLISKHMVCSIQTLPCIRISTISKLTKPSFHLSLFTQEYQIVPPKWFLRLWCIRRKLCTYLALKLTMSTHGPKQDLIWHTSSRSSIGCVQIDS
jgi:hypothetical protein